MALPGDLINGFPALASIQDPVGLDILRHAQPLSLPAGQVVFRLGDTCAHYLLVTEGKVKVVGRALNGRELLLYRIDGCGTCVLTTSCLLGQKRYPAEGITETAVSAYALPQALFRQGLDQSPDFRNFVFNTYGQRLSSLITLVQEIAFERIDLRLARYLVEKAADRVELLLTHQDLATELGSAREVISRQLKEFERRGWLHLGRGSIQIDDLTPLREFASAHAF